MKPRNKRRASKLLSVFTALSLSAAMVALPVVPSLTANAGLISNVIAGKWGAIALGAIERGVLYGIAQAKNAAQEDGMYQALRWTQRILAGNSGLVASDTLAAVKQMSAQLNALVSYTYQSTGEMKDMLDKLETDNRLNDFKKCFNAVKDFGSGYNNILIDFDSFFDAVIEYNDAYQKDPASADKTKLGIAYTNLITRYFSSDSVENDFFITPLVGSPKVTALLSYISPYDFQQTLDEEADYTDPSHWEGAGSTGVLTGDTYMETFYSYIINISNFETNVRSKMISAANFAADSLYKYIQAYRYFVEFKTMLLSADSSDYIDPSSAQISTDKKISTLWDNFTKNTSITQRALNQMMTIHSEVYDTFMRDYDTETTLEKKDYESDQLLFNAFNYYVNDTGYCSNFKWDVNTPKNATDCIYFGGVHLKKNKIGSKEKAYQFKLVSEADNKAYAIRESGESNEPFYVIDMSTDVQATSGKLVDAHSTVISMDALNLLKDTTNGYKVPRDRSGFSAIIAENNKARSSVQTVVDYISGELAYGGINANLPNVTYLVESTDGDTIRYGPNFLLVKSPLYWEEHNAALNMFAYHDMNMEFSNANMASTPKTGVMDLEDMAEKADESGESLYQKEMVVMYTGKPTATLDYHPINTNRGDTVVTVIPLQDYLGGSRSGTVVERNTAPTIESGSIVDVAFRPTDNNTLDYIVLKDSKGKIIDSLINDETIMYDPDASIDGSSKPNPTQSYTITAQEQLANCPVDENGYYHLVFPMPYQDCRLEIMYSNDDYSLYTYTSTLHDEKTDNGNIIMQYGGYEYIANKEFRSGETVDVIATGYNGAISEGLRFTDANNNPIDIQYTETTGSTVRVSPMERSFRFTMPRQDIHVYPVSVKSYNVTVYDEDSHCRHVFAGLNCFDVINLQNSSGWEKTQTISYVPGETVYIDFETDPGFVLKSVDIDDIDNKKKVTPIPTENGVRFTMPEGNVTVYASSERANFDQYVASIVNPEGINIRFLSADGNAVNISSIQVYEGDEVSFQAEYDEIEYRLDGITLTDADGEPVELTESGYRRYKFTMPAKDVTITGSSTKLYKIVAFAYSDNCISDELYYEDGSITPRGYEQGNNVVLDATDALLDSDIRILSASDQKDITSKVSLTKDRENKKLMFTMPAQDVMVSVPALHDYSNGICTVCGHYETPAYKNYYYQIRNAGNLLWYDSLVNGINHEYADYSEQNVYAGAELKEDIDLENRPWTPLGSKDSIYMGTIHGNGHTIRNINLDHTGDPNGGEQYYGFIGVGKSVMVYDVRLEGKAALNMPNGSGVLHFGSVAGDMHQCSLDHVFSHIDVDAKNSESDNLIVGGLCAKASDNNNFILGCVNYGSIKGYIRSAGGIAGYATNVKCRWSANIGDIDITGTIKGGVSIYSSDEISSCYNYGSLGSDSCADTVYYDNSRVFIFDNNYYLTGSASKMAGIVEPKSADEFKSGMVGYMLNKGALSGNYLFYQNIDNGKTPDDYPVPDSSKGLIYYIEAENRYSNFPDGINPDSFKKSVSIDTDRFILGDDGSVISYITFDSTGNSDPIRVSESSEITLSYTEDEDHYLAEVTTIGQVTGVITTLDFSDGTIYCHVQDEDIIIVPDFKRKQPPEPETVVVSIDSNAFIYGKNNTATSYLTFDSTGTSEPLTAEQNTDVLIRYTEDGTHYLSSVKGVGQTTGLTTYFEFLDGEIFCYASDEDLLIVPNFMVKDEPDPDRVTVSLDTSTFVYDENGDPVVYATIYDYDTEEYTSGPIKMQDYMNLITGEFCYDDRHYPVKTTVIGKTSGTVIAEKSHYETTEDYFVILEKSCSEYGEDLIVRTEFAEKSAPEPAEDHGIRTYEELCEFAQNVKDNYESYKNVSVWLENNIIAPKDSTWAEAIGSENKPFNGTFDGRGFAIVGLNITDKDTSGLFGYLGSSGTVKDLAVIKSNCLEKAQAAGGITAYNYGTIDHCISGINTDLNRIGVTIRDYNSNVYGTVSGGIAAYNYGTITGSRNCAYVLGNDVAGIAAVNNGTIYACANNGPLGKNSSEIKRVGGLTVDNHGTVTACYGSGKLNGSAKTLRAALTITNDGSITDCYYTTMGGTVSALGAGTSSENVSAAEKDIDMMTAPAFADTLNSVTDDSITWKHVEARNTKLNQGFPIVKGRFIEQLPISDDAKLRISANMLGSMRMSCAPLSASSAKYDTMKSSAGTRTVSAAYDLTASSPDGELLPAELWCEGITVSVAVSSDDVSIITVNENGETEVFAPDSIENGMATFTLLEPAAFAVAENVGTDPVKPGDDNVKTGENGLPLTAACTAAMVSVFTALIARRKKERE